MEWNTTELLRHAHTCDYIVRLEHAYACFTNLLNTLARQEGVRYMCNYLLIQYPAQASHPGALWCNGDHFPWVRFTLLEAKTEPNDRFPCNSKYTICGPHITRITVKVYTDGCFYVMQFSYTIISILMTFKYVLYVQIHIFSMHIPTHTYTHVHKSYIHLCFHK